MTKKFSLPLAAVVLIASASLTTTAQAGGFWGKCAAWSSGKTYYFSNGNFNKQVCFNKVRKHFGAEQWTAKYYSNPILISGNPVIVVRN